MLSSLPLLFPSFGREDPSWGTSSWGFQLQLDLCPLFYGEWGCFGKGRVGIRQSLGFLTVFLAKWMKEGRTFREPKWFLPQMISDPSEGLCAGFHRESCVRAMQWVCAWKTGESFPFFLFFRFLATLSGTQAYSMLCTQESLLEVLRGHYGCQGSNPCNHSRPLKHILLPFII